MRKLVVILGSLHATRSDLRISDHIMNHALYTIRLLLPNRLREWSGTHNGIDEAGRLKGLLSSPLPQKHATKCIQSPCNSKNAAV